MRQKYAKKKCHNVRFPDPLADGSDPVYTTPPQHPASSANDQKLKKYNCNQYKMYKCKSAKTEIQNYTLCTNICIAFPKDKDHQKNNVALYEAQIIGSNNDNWCGFFTLNTNLQIKEHKSHS